MYVTHNMMKYIYENIIINKRTIITVVTIYILLVLEIRMKVYSVRTRCVG